MCVSHAQISYFHCPYLMERMQNGGSGSTVSDRAFMSCVEEISPQWYNVGLKQVMKSLDAGHPLEDKLAKIRPSVTEEEVDSIGEEETTVMIISARKDALLVLKESMYEKRRGKSQSFISKDTTKYLANHIKMVQENVMGRDQMILEYTMKMVELAAVSGRNKSAENKRGVLQPSNSKLGPAIIFGRLHEDVTIRISTSSSGGGTRNRQRPRSKDSTAARRRAWRGHTIAVVARWGVRKQHDSCTAMRAAGATRPRIGGASRATTRLRRDLRTALRRNLRNAQRRWCFGRGYTRWLRADSYAARLHAPTTTAVLGHGVDGVDDYLPDREPAQEGTTLCEAWIAPDYPVRRGV